jgi:hypothetical protein
MYSSIYILIDATVTLTDTSHDSRPLPAACSPQQTHITLPCHQACTGIQHVPHLVNSRGQWPQGHRGTDEPVYSFLVLPNPYPLPHLEHLDPNQPYHDDPNAAYYDRYVLLYSYPSVRVVWVLDGYLCFRVDRPHVASS